MHALYFRVFEPAVIDGRPNPAHLTKAAYLAAARAAAARVAAANGAPGASVNFPDEETFAPVHVRVEVTDRVEVAGRGVTLRALAEAELGPGGGGVTGFARGGGYTGPLAMRQGRACARTSRRRSTAWPPPPAPTVFSC